ncbi:TraB/GumN family protein [Thaumasiovibrio sp. DFM-14]|uniref:TraB/GumN family protein n=1 Tax=Thaumasiovibrio sp. DFM-14 TaxID=3384792 RepID=UPI0039A1899B
MFKRRGLAQFTTALLFSLFSVSISAAPLVWTASQGQSHYTLIGSVHMGDSGMSSFEDMLSHYVKEADGVIVEANILQPASPLSATAIATTTRDNLTTQQQATLRSIANQLKLPFRHLMNAPPWLTALQLQLHQAQQAGLRPEWGIDIQVLQSAHAQAVPIIELEGIEQQMALLSQLPENGLPLLLHTLEEWQPMQEMVRCMSDAWQAGDLAAFERLLDDSRIDNDTDNALIYQRNRHWSEQLKGHIAPGHYLVVVGMLHMVGPQGLPSLLKQHGFTVEQASQSQSSHCYQ